MLRCKDIFSLTVWVVAAVIFAPSVNSACIWCDFGTWLNFQDCFYWGIRNDPSFGQISVGALDDMKNSVTAASQAIKSKSSSPMKMLVGAMAGDLCEMIKPVSRGNERAKAVLINIVRECSIDVIGEPDLIFTDELDRTLGFMMNEPSNDNLESAPNGNDAFFQNSVQSLTNQANFNGQNSNNPIPDINNMQQSQFQQISPSEGSIMNNAAPYRGNNQQAPNGIPFPNDQNAGSRFLTNGASGFSTSNQNPSTNPSITNANAASNSYAIAQNSGIQQQTGSANFERRPNDLYQYPSIQTENANFNPGSRPPPLNKPQITGANAISSANSYNLENAYAISNTNQNKIQNQFSPKDFSPIYNQAPNYPTNNLQNQQFPSQSKNQPQSSFAGGETKTFDINAQNAPQNYQENQFNQYPVTNVAGLGQSGTEIQRQTIQNNAGTFSYDGKSPKYGRKLQNGTPGLKNQQRNKISRVTNQKNLLPSQNDDVARAMRFVETLYVILSQSNSFKSVFNEQISNDQALSLLYTIVVGTLNDCGYSRFSVEIADACTVLIQSLPDECSFVQYAEALSKGLMDQLNIKKLIGQNPEDQAQRIGNNLLRRLNQKIPSVITTTTTQSPLAPYTESTILLGSGSQLQATNTNSESYSLYQNPDIQTQLINSNGAGTYQPNAGQNIPQNNLQNQFLQGNNIPINNALPGYLTDNKPQNQLNFGPGLMNQQPYSSVIVPNKVRENSNLQNTDKANNAGGIKNAAVVFYQKLFNDLLTCPYINSFYNELTTIAKAKTITETLLLGSLSANYDRLAIEIARECIRRLDLVQTALNTETYTMLIVTCITDVFSYYGLISQTPSSQASDISSKIIAWLQGNTNKGNNDQLVNKNTDVLSNLPNQGAMDNPDSYPGVPNLIQGQQPASSDILFLNSERKINYNPNTNNLSPQYQPYDLNSPPITNGGSQSIRTFSNANSSTVKTNKNKGKNKNKNKKGKKIVVSKTNFNYDNLNDYPINNIAGSKPNFPPDASNGDYIRDYNSNLNYQPNNVPNTQWPGAQNFPAQNVNQNYDLTFGATNIQNDNLSGQQQSASSSVVNSPPGDPNSSPDTSNGNYIRDYNSNLNYQPNNVPNTQWPGAQNFPVQNVNQDYGLIPGATNTQNDNISGLQQSALSSAVNSSPRKKKCNNLKNKKGSNTGNKSLISDDLDASNNPSNVSGPPALDTTNNPATFQSNTYAGSSSNDFNAVPYQNTAPKLSQSQIIPVEKNDEVKDRIRYLTKAVLSNLSNGKFDYKSFSYIIADITDNLLATHPELGSQKSLVKILIDSIIACIQLLTKVPSNYFDNISVLQDLDTPDAVGIDYSKNFLPVQADQNTIQTNQNNVALNDQSYKPSTLPQQNNFNNDKIGNFYPGGSPNTIVPSPNQGSANNVALNDLSYGPLTPPPQQNNLNNNQIRNFNPSGLAPFPNTNILPTNQGSANNVALNDISYGTSTLPQQNNFNNDQIRNFNPDGSVPLQNTNLPPRQGPVNNVPFNDLSYGPPTLPQQNNLNNDQIGQRNFYADGSAPLPNTNVPPPRQSSKNNAALNDLSNGLPTLQQNNFNNDQIGQRNFYPGGAAPIPNTSVPPRQDFGIQNLPQGARGNGLSNAQTFSGISSQTGQDKSPPGFLNRYGSQSLPLNNQNNIPSGEFNNPNLQSGNMGNQNIQSGSSFETGLYQANQMYNNNLP